MSMPRFTKGWGEENPHGSLSMKSERRQVPVSDSRHSSATAASMMRRLLPRFEPMFICAVNILLVSILSA